MENKFQQQKSATNNNNTTKYNVYHTNAHENNKTYMRANNNHNNNNNNNAAGPGDGPSTDVFALLKENKQLKAMLILHLDLIQEQNDQLQYKDKKLAALSERLDAQVLARQQLEVQVQELQCQLQRQINRANVSTKELTSVSPPPLAKIQNNVDVTAQQQQQQQQQQSQQHKPIDGNKHIIGECNGKLISKIKLQRVGLTLVDDTSANSSCTSSETQSDEEAEFIALDKSDDTEAKNDDDDADGDGDEHSDDDEDDDENTEEDVEDGPEEYETKPAKPNETTASAEHPKDSKSTLAESMTNPLKLKLAAPVVQQICVTPPTPSRGKQMPLMLWHAPDMHSDESGSGESMGDSGEQPLSVEPTTKATAAAEPPTSHESNKPTVGLVAAEARSVPNQPLRRSRRLAYITSSQLYYTREWVDTSVPSDCEQIKGEKVLKTAATEAQLEIPKWIEHELSPLYCIEGTEDLSDDTFLKRHAKLELDEKRRKKWDVQQIREQRRIEKLKRRHCKDELQIAQDQQQAPSFYPQADDITTIFYTSQLPVQAFGEMIPKLNTTTEFTLPWLREPEKPKQSVPPQQQQQQQQQASTSAESQGQTRVPVLSSTYNFVKKRRRRQSSSTTNVPTARQRSLAAAKASTEAATK